MSPAVGSFSRGMVGRIYEGDFQTLLHTSSGSCGFREDFFFNISHCKSMGAIC